ncbi:hypothetical protein FNV43_RR04516 [Rhamnella rubrinervis]|uniref:Uncharacterized protein n=1 Tax=Rhamnella rubrinervis TaxID=2594499 RepID=A0A8K0MQ54_9ROSA|nr:hypothetical protein FNV43_RR04516 [Rhamnella rubrinervis]
MISSVEGDSKCLEDSIPFPLISHLSSSSMSSFTWSDYLRANLRLDLVGCFMRFDYSSLSKSPSSSLGAYSSRLSIDFGDIVIFPLGTSTRKLRL